MEVNLHYLYKLVVEGTHKCYIGQTENVDQRFQRHISTLRSGKHHNIHLQEYYDNNNPKITIEVICESDSCVDGMEEQLILENYDNLFNVSKKAKGGDTISYHPLNEDIRCKISNASKIMWSNIEYRGRRKGVSGENNPNYKDGRTLIMRQCFDCGKEVKTYYEIDTPLSAIKCQVCVKPRLFGEDNPFFGKTHTEETKQLISESKKSRFLRGDAVTKQCKKILANGKVFFNCADCARYYGVSNGTITFRVRSENYDFHYYNENTHKGEYEIMPRILERLNSGS